MGKPPPTWDEVHNYTVHGSPKLRLALFWTKDAMLSSPSVAYVKTCSDILQRYGVGLDLVPKPLSAQTAGVPTPDMTLNWSGDVTAEADVLTVRALANAAYNDKSIPGLKRLPILFCPLGTGIASRDGESDGMPRGITFTSSAPWPPFVVINSKTESKDDVTLAHEIGHAAGLGHQASNGYVMNYFPPERSEFLPYELNKIVGAYFCKGL